MCAPSAAHSPNISRVTRTRKRLTCRGLYADARRNKGQSEEGAGGDSAARRACGSTEAERRKDEERRKKRRADLNTHPAFSQAPLGSKASSVSFLKQSWQCETLQGNIAFVLGDNMLRIRARATSTLRRVWSTNHHVTNHVRGQCLVHTQNTNRTELTHGNTQPNIHDHHRFRSQLG